MYYQSTNFVIAIRFQLQEQFGPQHAPNFTYVCAIASIKRAGSCTSRKMAKQIAAEKILNIVRLNENIVKNELVRKIDSKEVIRKFKDYKMEIKEHFPIAMKNRHNYLIKLTKEKKADIIKILGLCDNSVGMLPAEDVVGLICSMLDITTSVRNLGFSDYKMIQFDIDMMDCVFVGTNEDVWNKVVDFFHNMVDGKGYLKRIITKTA